MTRMEVDEKSLVRLVAALRSEADGKELGRELALELRAVAEPALQAARGALMSMPSSTHDVPGLRSTVAARTRISVRLSGKHPGVAIRASKAGMPRQFNNAPKRLNAAKGWRHTVFGDDSKWVTQLGMPGWFDDTIPKFKPAAQKAAKEAMDNMARRIDLKTRG